MNLGLGPLAPAVPVLDDDPFAEHPGAVARRRRNGRRYLFLLLGAVLLGQGGWTALHVTYTPEPGPKAVCPMLRPELLDVALPDRDPARDGSERTESGFLGATCTVRGASGELWIGVTRVGRAGGDSPWEILELRRGWIGELRQVRLGDDALLVDDQLLQIRHGSYLVWIEYAPEATVAPEARRQVLVAIGQEVLSQL
ncbi:hypothetical protein [Catellatospora paridis]|uniref:hypothetical protein n=1 Tax=Catellatospora paridis TaxID=1617086 RepID=UPI0012D3EE6D|nr:hypothetical protein [Catellatospora paridis]